MTNKMVARLLTYELGSLSYGNSKLLEKKITKRTVVKQSLSLVYSKWVFSDAVINGTVFSNN